MKKENYKSDIQLSVQLTLGGVEIDPPQHDFMLKFSTSGLRHYICSYQNGVYSNCRVENGKIICFLDNHRLQAGVLRCEYYDYIPDNDFADGDQLKVVPRMLDVELVTGAGDDAIDIETEIAIEIIGVIADARTATNEANAAAASANSAASAANSAANAANIAANNASETTSEMQQVVAQGSADITRLITSGSAAIEQAVERADEAIENIEARTSVAITATQRATQNAVALATDATDAANTAAETANAATLNANAAAHRANNSAQNTNQAIETANIAADRADASAENANAAADRADEFVDSIHIENYYTKDEINTKFSEIISGKSWLIVGSLPIRGSSDYIYLVPNGGSGSNVYDEYVWLSFTGRYEKIGSTSVDLSNYYTKSESDARYTISATEITNTINEICV